MARAASTYRSARKAIVASMSPETRWRDTSASATFTPTSGVPFKVRLVFDAFQPLPKNKKQAALRLKKRERFGEPRVEGFTAEITKYFPHQSAREKARRVRQNG